MSYLLSQKVNRYTIVNCVFNRSILFISGTNKVSNRHHIKSLTLTVLEHISTHLKMNIYFRFI